VKNRSIVPVKLSGLLLAVAGTVLVLSGCQRTVTMSRDSGFTPAVIQRDRLVEMRAEGAEKSMALIRKEADVGSLRAEDIRPVISGSSVRLPPFITPGAGESRFGIGGNSRRPSMFFVVKGLDWTPEQLHRVIVDGNVTDGPITKVLVWKRNSAMAR
jgi:hypothetical protein